MSEDSFLREGYTVYISEPYGAFYKIVRREPFDYETGEESGTPVFSTVAPGASSGYKNIEILEPDNEPLHLLQVLWGVADYQAKYYIKLPTGQNRFGLDDDKEIGFIDASKCPYTNPDPKFGFWLIQDWYPSINCVNNSAVTMTPKIWFTGMKYDIQKITDQNTIAALAQSGLFRRVIFGGVKNTP